MVHQLLALFVVGCLFLSPLCNAAGGCSNGTVVAQDGDLRLVGGSVDYEGRVEICHNNEWGTVCDDGWDDGDARVVCRQLGFPLYDVTSYTNAYFGQGSGQIWLSTVTCKGNEYFLMQCSVSSFGDNSCTHSQDAGVHCPAPSPIAPTYCNSSGDVRLVGGRDIYEGRVEICFNSSWVTFCDHYWSIADAIVVCRQLGYPTSGASWYSFAYFGPGSGVIGVSNVYCNGTESRLDTCSFFVDHLNECDHVEDVGVRCVAATLCTTGDLRLVGSSNSYEGRVEICQNNEWGTICYDWNRWDKVDASVVCQQLGYSIYGAIPYENAYFGAGTGRIWLSQIFCSRYYDSSLSTCRSVSYNSDCSHSRDVGVRCATEMSKYCNSSGDLRLVGGSNYYEGRVEICHNNEWGTICDNGWDDVDARIVCRHLQLPLYDAISYKNAYFGRGSGQIWLSNVTCKGNEYSFGGCSSNSFGNNNCTHSQDAGVHCPAPPPIAPDYCNSSQNGGLRLVGGRDIYEGRVEICLSSYRLWGNICDDCWSDADAIVVCRQLGYPTSDATSYSRAYFGPGRGPILLTNVLCNGSESRLVDCQLNRADQCIHIEDAGVRCANGTNCTAGDVRLAGGSNYYEGRVEICHKNEWGTICDDFWNNNDARVVCRQLGLPTEDATWFTNAYFGCGSGQIWLDSVTCYGNESSLSNCSASSFAPSYCYSNSSGGLRLVGGSNYYEGQVEICYQNKWETVCDDGWSDADAKVVCRQLGYPTSGATSYSHGQEIGPIWYRLVRCIGTESRLVDCPFLVKGLGSHIEDAGVRCANGTTLYGSLIGGSIGGLLLMICLSVMIILFVSYIAKRRRKTARATQAGHSVLAAGRQSRFEEDGSEESLSEDENEPLLKNL